FLNVRLLPKVGKPLGLDRGWDLFGKPLGLDQGWDLFAPRPTILQGRVIVRGFLADGSDVDLLRAGAPVSWEAPQRLGATFPNTRWKKLMIDLHAPTYAFLLPHFADWHFREWHRRHPDRPLERVEVWTVRTVNLIDREQEQQRSLLCSYRAWFVARGV